MYQRHARTYTSNSDTHHQAFHTNLILGLCKRYAQDPTLNLTKCGGDGSKHHQPTTDKLPQLHPARHGTRQHQHQGYQREFVTTPTSYYEQCTAHAQPARRSGAITTAKRLLPRTRPKIRTGIHNPEQDQEQSLNWPGVHPYATSGGQYVLTICQV